MKGRFVFVGFAGPFLVVLVVLLLAASVKVLREYERAVVFQLGRFTRVKGPGLMFLVPGIQQIVRVDLRTVVMEVPRQEMISRDNVSVKVDAVLYFHVVDPAKSVIAVEQFVAATNLLAQTTLRSVLGQHDLDDLLTARTKLNTAVQDILDARTKAWGIEVSAVEIKDVQLTDNMVKAIAKQAEAERDRRAKVIHADAEFQASHVLVDAAKVLGSVPAAMQLRYLQTLTEVGGENNSTIIFPMPIDLLKPLMQILDKTARDAEPQAPANGVAIGRT